MSVDIAHKKIGGDCNRNGRTPEERFWNQVQRRGGEECWEWQGAIMPNGYGYVNSGQKMWYAHRLSWILSCGQHPGEMFVCHHCDNRKCVRPDHLFLGTRQDNMNDMKRKGRQRNGSACGEKSGRATFTDDVIVAIRKAKSSGCSIKEISNATGVSVYTLRDITNRRTWKHLP